VILWRLSRFASLDGRGGLLASSRWHTAGRPILFFAPNPATALLEVLVHSEVRDPEALAGYSFIKVELPDDLSVERVDEEAMPREWPSRIEVSRARGDRWLSEAGSLALEVRCVIVPETWNLVVNPMHPDMEQVRTLAVLPYEIDGRLTD